jgi:hypothetical protein
MYRIIIFAVVLYGCNIWFSHTEGRTSSAGVWEQGPEEDIWAYAGRGNREVEESVQWSVS